YGLVTAEFKRISIRNPKCAYSNRLKRREFMSGNGHMTAAKIRASLRHPIIDADGHWLEYGPVVREQLKKIGGEKAVEGFGLFGAQVVNALSMSVADRRNQRSA